jgi:hypothetical protein
MEYRVKWEIDVDARSPREAAHKALKIQRDPESIATVFEVGYHKKTRTQSGKVRSAYRRDTFDLLNTR